MRSPPKSLHARKLLVASVGVATINYVAAACGIVETGTTSGNLPAPVPSDASRSDAIPVTSGNLPSPAPYDAATDVLQDAREDAIPPTSGNLPSPVPIDASKSDG